jgi:hypothetical protein
MSRSEYRLRKQPHNEILPGLPLKKFFINHFYVPSLQKTKTTNFHMSNETF